MVGPDCFLKMARELAGSNEEIYIRESMVAAFYAAYHECAILAKHLQNHGGMGKQSGSHEDLIKKLSQFPKNNPEGLCENTCQKIKVLGHKLRNCRAQRRLASYDLETDIGIAERDEHFISIEEVLALIETINEMIDESENSLDGYKQYRKSLKKN